jgi:heterodisulfide reductase subunit B
MTASFLYYPGCSMDGSAKAYASSLEVVCRALGIDLHEIDDWNCCGASEYVSLSQAKAHALVGRNLALAERQRNGSSTSSRRAASLQQPREDRDHYVDGPTVARERQRRLRPGFAHPGRRGAPPLRGRRGRDRLKRPRR